MSPDGPKNIDLDHCLDDLLIRTPSQAEALSNTKHLLDLVHKLCFHVNIKKSEPNPTRGST